MSLEGIPQPMIDRAYEAGLAEDEIAAAWVKYVKFHNKTFGRSSYRMVDWDRDIKWALKARVERVPSTAESRAAAAREDALRNARLEDEAYAREAVPFDVWVASLPKDDPVRRYRDLHPGLTSFDTIMGFGAEQAAKHREANPKKRQKVMRPSLTPVETLSDDDYAARLAEQREMARELQGDDFWGSR